MVTQKLLIRKEKSTGKVISQQLLFDDETTEHIIIDNLPTIEERPGFIGEYVVKADGTVEVVHTEKPKTQLDIIQEQLGQLLGTTNTLAGDSLLSMEMAVTTDMKVDEINTKVDMITPQ